MRQLIALVAAILIAACATAGAQIGTAPATNARIVNQIQFTGNTIISSDELMKVIKIKPGDLVTAAKIESAVTAIQQEYRRRGYFAIVTEEVGADFADTGTLTFPVVEAKVAEVRITGLKKTREFVVRRMLELEPGDYYYVPALNRDADRIFALNIFESVDADVQPTQEPGGMIVTWRLVERQKTGNIQLGGSYAPSERLVGDLTYVESNLGGRAQQLGISTSIGTIRGRVGGEIYFTDPWIAANRSLTLRAFSNYRYRFSEDLSSTTGRYFERTRGGQALSTKTLSATRRFTLGTRFENVKVEDLPLALLTPSLASADGKVLAVSGEMANDKRDSRSYPTTGRFWSATLEPGRADMESEGRSWITKASGRVQQYFPLGKVPPAGTAAPARRPPVLAGRLQLGTSAGKLPFFEQYFVGGVYGLRGYTEQRFWGKHMVLATAEYRHPIGSRLTGVAFVDAGDAWGSRFQFIPGASTDFDQHESFSPRAGAGFGVRYNTSYGPLGLDFAWGEDFHTHLVLGQQF